MKKKFFITTTIPATLGFFKGNLAYLNEVFEVYAISSQKDELNELGRKEGIKTFFIPMRRPISLFYDIVSLFRFIKLFLVERPDIVHGNTPKASLLSMVSAKLSGVKVRIYMCHGLRYQGTTGIMRLLLMKMEKITCACATEVICVSKGVRNILIEDGICAKNKAVVIHHGSASGIDLDYFKIDSSLQNTDVREKLGISLTDFVFIFVGRIVKDKGVNELISSFEKLHSQINSVHLILVGSEEKDLNPISKKNRETIETHLNIHAVGRQIDIRPYLLSSDAFVLPSYREGFGMVLLEAGAMGLPCITTNISGCNEIVIQGENGEIIPPRDEKALYEKMKDWVVHKDKLAYMSSHARSFVENRFDKKTVWLKLLDEYNRLLTS